MTANAPAHDAAAIAEEKVSDFTLGYLIAVANIMHLHGEEVIARNVLTQLGVKRSVLKDTDFDDFDMKPLRALFREVERLERVDRARLRAHISQAKGE